MLLPFQGASGHVQLTQGVALGYVLIGLSGRLPLPSLRLEEAGELRKTYFIMTFMARCPIFTIATEPVLSEVLMVAWPPLMLSEPSSFPSAE